MIYPSKFFSPRTSPTDRSFSPTSSFYLFYFGFLGNCSFLFCCLLYLYTYGYIIHCDCRIQQRHVIWETRVKRVVSERLALNCQQEWRSAETARDGMLSRASETLISHLVSRKALSYPACFLLFLS